MIALYFISVLSPNFYVLSVIQFGLGFSSAVFFGPMMNDISYFFKKKRGLAVSITASAQHFAGAIWPFLLTFFKLYKLRSFNGKSLILNETTCRNIKLDKLPKINYDITQ